jgi:hypothetical protein
MTRVLSSLFSVAVIFSLAVETTGQEVESPRLRALQEAIKQDSGAAIESFWTE